MDYQKQLESYFLGNMIEPDQNLFQIRFHRLIFVAPQKWPPKFWEVTHVTSLSPKGSTELSLEQTKKVYNYRKMTVA